MGRKKNKQAAQVQESQEETQPEQFEAPVDKYESSSEPDLEPKHHDIDPDIQQLAYTFKIDPGLTQKLNNIMIEKRMNTWEQDLERLYEILKDAHTPAAMLNLKVKDMQKGTFVGKAKCGPRVRDLARRHRLDKGAATKLEEAMSMREAMGKDVEKDIVLLDEHLTASNKPSALISMKLESLRKGYNIGHCIYSREPVMGNTGPGVDGVVDKKGRVRVLGYTDADLNSRFASGDGKGEQLMDEETVRKLMAVEKRRALATGRLEKNEAALNLKAAKAAKAADRSSRRSGSPKASRSRKAKCSSSRSRSRSRRRRKRSSSRSSSSRRKKKKEKVEKAKDKGEKGEKGKRGPVPWSFVPLCADGDPLGLWQISQQVPTEWVDFGHGGKVSRERLHVTFALRMSRLDHLDRLEKVCGDSGPVELKVKEFFLSLVERIRDAEVYCIGVSFESPGLRALKESWLEGMDESAKRSHDPYPSSDGHVSLAYIQASSYEVAKDFVDANRSTLEGKSFLVEGISYEDERRERTQFKLTGEQGPGPAAPSKAARTAPSEVVEVDGSVLEGGGQILRNSLGYAAILGYPVRISKIRAGRKTPGLAAQHLESFKLVRDLTSATLEGDKVGSCQVTFVPKKLKEGSFSTNPKTAGAISLTVQAGLFPLAFAGGTSEVEMRGGTDVDFSPPFDFMLRALAPSVERMGVKMTADCQHRGFFPTGGGLVNLIVSGLKGTLKPIVLDKRGHVTKVEAICYATPPSGWLDDEDVNRTEDDFEPWLLEELADRDGPKPKVQVRCEPQQMPEGQKVFKAGCDIVVHMSGGGCFHASGGPLDGPKGRGSLYDVWGAAAEKALVPLKAQLKTGAALDEHLLDQLILPATLAEGTSRLLGSKELTLHAQTALYLAEKMVPGVRVQVTPQAGLKLVEITGIARKVGAPPLMPEAAGGSGDMVAQLPPGTLSKVQGQVITDLRGDLGHLSANFRLRVEAEVASDCFRVQGCEGPDHAAALRKELEAICKYYAFPAPRWR
mmetsp:Transcript_99050/g.236355  ORF Transcript_99050/g.236355 Transcript_99050/m.236355 type:complete len:1014 (-) Transcript_99050:67-3108(-)